MSNPKKQRLSELHAEHDDLLIAALEASDSQGFETTRQRLNAFLVAHGQEVVELERAVYGNRSIFSEATL